MTTEAFSRSRPFIVRALVQIQGKHPQQITVPVRGRIDCPKCRSTLTYTLQPSRAATGQCSAAGCLRFDQ